MINFKTLIMQNIKKQKISIPQLARRAGVDPNILYRYVKGQTEMRADKLESVLNALEE